MTRQKRLASARAKNKNREIFRKDGTLRGRDQIATILEIGTKNFHLPGSGSRWVHFGRWRFYRKHFFIAKQIEANARKEVQKIVKHELKSPEAKSYAKHGMKYPVTTLRRFISALINRTRNELGNVQLAENVTQ